LDFLHALISDNLSSTHFSRENTVNILSFGWTKFNIESTLQVGRSQLFVTLQTLQLLYSTVWFDA
jgi:hypothetical protein